MNYLSSLLTKQLSHLYIQTHIAYFVPLLLLSEMGVKLEYGKGIRTEGLTDEGNTGR